MWNLIADYAPDALALLGGLIVVVCTLRDFSLEESKPTTRSTRRRLAVAIALGGVMSIVGAFLSSQQNGHFQKELAGKANELKLKSDEIAGLNRKIADYLSGGNSFCYVTADNENTTESKELLFYYRQRGDTPTWDVKLLVTDAYAYGRLMPKLPAHSLIPLSEMTDKQLSQLREAANTKFAVQVGNLSPSENGVAFKTAATPGKKRYEIQILTRNGYFVETLLTQKVNGRWVSAYRVWKSALEVKNPNEPPKEKVDEYVNPQFPKADIPWDETQP